MPRFESDADTFIVTLPSLLYGFSDEELVAQVTTPPVTPPVEGKAVMLLLALERGPLGTSELSIRDFREIVQAQLLQLQWQRRNGELGPSPQLVPARLAVFLV